MDRIEQAYHDGTVLDMTIAFCALTGDIVTHYKNGQSLGSLHGRDFRNDIRGGTGVRKCQSSEQILSFSHTIAAATTLVPRCSLQARHCRNPDRGHSSFQNAPQNNIQQVSFQKKKTLIGGLTSSAVPPSDSTSSSRRGDDPAQWGY